MKMFEASVFFLFTLVVSIRVVVGGDLKQVNSYAEFETEMKSSSNVVLIVTAQNCEPCQPVLDQVRDKCAKLANVNCYAADIGDYTMDNTFYDAKTLKIAYIPYVAYFKNGEKKCAANQEWAVNNSKYVNAGFRIFNN